MSASDSALPTPSGRGLRLLRLPPAGTLLALGFLFLLTLAALDPHFFTSAGPLTIAPFNAFAPPSLAHWFGTDASGRDLFSRVIYGARQSLALGVSSVALAMVLAVILGLTGGLGGRLAEHAIGWVLDVLFSFPTLILALLFAAHLGGGIGPLIIATGIGTAPGFGRLVFTQVLTVRHAGYIEAARALGHSPTRIILRQVLPNALRPLIAMVTMGVGQTIVWSSSLSFLGMGAPPPAPEWGTLLAMGHDYLGEAWWLTFFPGLFIVLTTLSTTLVGRYLQRRLEGRGE